MFISEAKKRFVVYVYVAALVVLSGLGQSLHQLAGLEHNCVCSATATSVELNGHDCGESHCPFEVGDHRTDGCDQPPVGSDDGCSVCRLLSTLATGVFYHADVETSLLAHRRELLPQPQICAETLRTSHVPRGPPVLA